MPSRADEIRTRQQAILSDLEALEVKLKEGPGEDELEQLSVRTDALTQEFDELKGELEPLAEREKKIAAVRAAMSQEANREETTAPEQQHSGPDLVVRAKRDPFADLDQVRTGITPAHDVRARALGAIELYSKRSDHWALDHDGAEQATRMVEKMGPRFGTAVARQMLVTGSPEYLAAFESYMSDPGGFSSRAALSLTPANGGYLVPFTLDPTIILTNSGSANPYRRFATIKTTATNDWNGVTSAGVSAEWTAEGIEAADATPTVGQLKITPQKADAYLFGSFEVLGDSDIATQLPELLADAKDRLEESAFAVGTGTGQPWGVIARGTTLAAAAGTAATGPGAADVYALSAALPARWRAPGSRPVWVGNITTMNRLRNVASFSGGFNPLLQDGPERSDPARLPVPGVDVRCRRVRQRQQGPRLPRRPAVLHRRPGRHVRRLRPDRPRREPPAHRPGGRGTLFGASVPTCPRRPRCAS
jgi:HK97 family phage major capsid protein